MMKNKTILFIGDSVTDAFRTTANDPCLPLGAGYPLLIASKLSLETPQNGCRFLNRGISGNRVTDLYARWEEDVLKLKPDVLSMLIGVNDVWHEFQHGTGTSLARFTRTYRALLAETQKALPDCTILLLEPFILPCGVVADDYENWSREMTARRAVVAQLAKEYACVFVPLQQPFEHAATLAPASFWLLDGVHPVGPGHALIAREWCKALQTLPQV